MDPLTEVLHSLRLSDGFYCRTEVRAPWGLALPPRDRASFHFVAEGSCWLRADAAPIRLEAGDLVLLPHGRGHRLSDTPGGRTQPIGALPHEQIGRHTAVLRHGGHGARSLLLCGAVRFESPGTPLLELLPDVLHVPGHGGRTEPWLDLTLQVMALEATTPRPGSETVITRLADVLVIGAVRAWLETSPDGRVGWLGALRDESIGRALALMHRRAEQPWTVASLASAVHMSGAVFSERFTGLVGVPPMHYLTRWRMHLASAWIREDQRHLGEVADRLGYASDASFSRAFKRHLGVSPGSVRRDRTHPGPHGTATPSRILRGLDIAATIAPRPRRERRRRRTGSLGPRAPRTSSRPRPLPPGRRIDA
jgi:AraC-like DNA-binding protein